ncbi:hypothetical protein A9Q73_02465 [Bermanella sp. 47_1433_sub80_T6]|nr:hypothetical protein A9Q73_02465 [Bermanella sp. 47_1433_sub80_T6]
MNKDKEPEHLASIALSREEIASRQRVTGKPRYTRTQEGSGNSKALWALTIFALLLAIALLIQLQQVKKQSDMQLQAITILQERLINTGEQSDLSLDAIRILVKDQNHEIRKLWDVTNKRNKNNIAKNKERLDDQSKQVTKYTGKLDLINKELNKQEKTLLNKLAKNKELAAAISSNLKADMAGIKSSMDKLSKKSDQALNSLPKNIQKTLKDHGKGIDAMDATRLRLMKRINAIDKELKALKKAQSAVTAPSPQATTP